MGDEPVAAREIDDATAPEATSRAARELPRFVELLAGEAIGLADGPPDAIEERLALEMVGGAGRQLDAARQRKTQDAGILQENQGLRGRLGMVSLAG